MFEKKRFSAVILCGGSSSRMGGVSKQLALVGGVPVAVRSMLAFEKCPECSEIIVVAKKDEMQLYPALIKEYGVTKFTHVTEGGQTRQESAFNGLNVVDKSSDFVAIHDAARCLITTQDISRVFAQAYKYNCAAACAKAVDTVKIVDVRGKTATSDQPVRDKLYTMQTPQIFLKELYEAAAYTAKREGYTGTDDCSLLEHAGFGCVPVETDRYNLKITTPEDLIVAEALIKAREEQV